MVQKPTENRDYAPMLLGGLLGLILLAALAGALGACSTETPLTPEYPCPLAAERDWYTSNEDPCCPGDWDGVMYYTLGGGAYVTRTTEAKYVGDYSYKHYSDCPDTTCWAFTYISCTEQMDEGYADVWVRWPDDLPGASALDYDFISAFEIDTVDPPVVDEAWTLMYDSVTGLAKIECYSCAPNAEWPLGTIVTNTWHEFEIYWDLPENIMDSGVLRVWQDGILMVDEVGLDTDAGGAGWYPVRAVGAGAKDWDFTDGDERWMYVDNVTINGCDEPMPTPTPEAGPCQKYGHAATLNIATNCSALIRFDGLTASIPASATVTSAVLHLYGVSMEEHGQWIYVSKLRPIWGEMTADWCSKRMWTYWKMSGARGVPHDRWGGYVGLFEAKLGWMNIKLPTDLVEEWLLTSGANPGLILYSEYMSGKVAVASREWYDSTENYGPQLVVNWE